MQQPTWTIWSKWIQQVRKDTQNSKGKDGHSHKMSLTGGQRILGRGLVI